MSTFLLGIYRSSQDLAYSTDVDFTVAAQLRNCTGFTMWLPPLIVCLFYTRALLIGKLFEVLLGNNAKVARKVVWLLGNFTLEIFF